MNSYQANKLSLPEIMSRMGYQPVDIRKGGNEYWYKSPFRAEKTASFHASYLDGIWVWYDFGDDNGTVVDFVMRHENASVSNALKYLDELYGKVGDRLKQTQSSFFHQQKASRSEAENFNELKFISAQPVQSKVIINYLTQQRGIDEALVKQYLQEVKYANTNNGKEYFAYGIKNESGGFEIRVASDKYSFKSSLIAKDVSLIKGFKSNGVINIFEGTTDFLSLLTMMKTNTLYGDSLLMHSVSSYDRALSLIKKGGYVKVNTFLDNDKSGRDHSSRFQNDLGNIVENQSEMFLPYIDLNEMLQSQTRGISARNPFTR